MGGDIQNAYTFFAKSPNISAGLGTIQNNYGLYIENQTIDGVNDYNIYSAGANSTNYFEGFVNIGGGLITTNATITNATISNAVIIDQTILNEHITNASITNLYATEFTTENINQVAGNPLTQGSTAASGAIEPYVVGRYAYITNCGDGITIIDLSNPNAPAVAGTLGGLGCAIGIQVAGNYAYVSTLSSNTFYIINISNPTSPFISGTLTDSMLSGGQQVKVSGKYAYVAAENTSRVVVVDVSSSTNPTIASSIIDFNLSGVRGLFIVGDYLYAAARLAHRVNVINISNPLAPILVGSTASLPLAGGLGQVANIKVNGKYAYVTGYENAGGTPAGSNALTVVDVSNPTAPTVVSSVSGSGGGTGSQFRNPVSVFISGRYVYMASAENGTVGQVTIFDIINPASPVQVGYIENTDLSAAQQLFISGRYGYVASYGNGLVTLKLSGNDFVTASVGNLSASYFNVFQDLNVSGQTFVGTSLNVGNGGIFTTGGLNGMGTSTIVGALGVGQSVANQTLDVAGTIRQTGATNCALSTNASGDIICTSDERLKDLHGEYEGKIDDLMKIKPIKFNYIEDDYVHVGFSAQNIHEIIPEGAPVQKNGFYGLDSNAILALSVNSIKDLYSKVLLLEIQSNPNQGPVNLDNLVGLLTDKIVLAFSSISDIFLNRIHVSEICVGDRNSGETCLNKNKLDFILNSNNSQFPPANTTSEIPVMIPENSWVDSTSTKTISEEEPIPTTETSTTTENN